MTLDERYSKAEVEVLVNIIENSADYTEECVLVVNKELDNRAIDPEELKAIASDIHQERAKKMMQRFDPYTDKIVPVESKFLTKDETLAIIKEEFDLWLEKREVFEFDVWKYAIGILAI